MQPNTIFHYNALMTRVDQSPTLGAHAHAHAHHRPCPWVLGGHGCDITVHGWTWVGIAAILMGVDSILLFMREHGLKQSILEGVIK